MAQVREANMMDHPVVKLPLCKALRRQLGDKGRPCMRAHLLLTSILAATKAGGLHTPNDRGRGRAGVRTERAVLQVSQPPSHDKDTRR